MPKISMEQFNNVKELIKSATNVGQCNHIYSVLSSLCPDKNILSLATLYNCRVLEQSHLKSTAPLLDLKHLEVLIALHNSARAVKQYREYLANNGFFNTNPLDFHTHIIMMNERIELLKDSSHYTYYCNYYYENIYSPLVQFHLKMHINPPSCVEQFVKPLSYSMDMILQGC